MAGECVPYEMTGWTDVNFMDSLKGVVVNTESDLTDDLANYTTIATVKNVGIFSYYDGGWEHSNIKEVDDIIALKKVGELVADLSIGTSTANPDETVRLFEHTIVEGGQYDVSIQIAIHGTSDVLASRFNSSIGGVLGYGGNYIEISKSLTKNLTAGQVVFLDQEGANGGSNIIINASLQIKRSR